MPMGVKRVAGLAGRGWTETLASRETVGMHGRDGAARNLCGAVRACCAYDKKGPHS